MKKSTLITTIAMIVVVVVALSTATYAWFTADSKTYATQTISTTATSDIVVLANGTRMLDTNTAATFNQETLLTHTIGSGNLDANLGIRKGLWAPVGAVISSYATGSNSSTASKTSAVVSFISGTQTADGTTFKVTTAPTVTSADMVRVTAMKSGTINLTIFVAAAEGEASQFAAQGVSFYLADASAKIANTDYYWASSTAANYTGGEANAIEQNDTATIATIFTKEDATGTITYNPAYQTAYAAASEQSKPAAINHRDTSISPGLYFDNIDPTANSNQGDAASQAGLSSFDTWYSMTISLGDFDANESKNFLLYNWLDGGYLTDAAGSADIGISYAFAFAE